MVLSAVAVCVFGVSTVDIGTIIVELLAFRSSTNDSLAVLSTIASISLLFVAATFLFVYMNEKNWARSVINGWLLVKMYKSALDPHASAHEVCIWWPWLIYVWEMWCRCRIDTNLKIETIKMNDIFYVESKLDRTHLRWNVNCCCCRRRLLNAI